MPNHPFQKDLLTELPEDVWLEWKINHPPIVNSVFLGGDDKWPFGKLLGYLEVDEVSQELDCIRIGNRRFMPVWEDDKVIRVFVTSFKGDRYDYTWLDHRFINSHTKSVKRVYLDDFQVFRINY